MATPLDVLMTSAPPPILAADEPKYGGFTRFEIELEFVQCLLSHQALAHLILTVSERSANPHYISHLATLTAPSNESVISGASTTEPAMQAPLLHHPPFIAYISYLQYFTQPPYTSYLTYPGPTLKNLKLLQSERFRRDILSPDKVAELEREMLASTERWMRTS